MLGTFPGVVSVGGFFSSDDNYRRAIVATNDGAVTEVFFNPQQGQGQAILGTFPGVVGVGGFSPPTMNAVTRLSRARTAS